MLQPDASVLGSAAVFITLGYLAVQVGHARREVQRSVSEGRAQMMREFNVNRINNSALAAANRRANLAFAAPPHPFFSKLIEEAQLTEAEVGLLFEEQWAYWRYRSHVIAYVDELLPGERAEFDGGVRFAYGTVAWGRLWYETIKPRLNPDTVRYIDNLLAQPA